jgi:hypothetical protein
MGMRHSPSPFASKKRRKNVRFDNFTVLDTAIGIAIAILFAMPFILSLLKRG